MFLLVSNHVQTYFKEANYAFDYNILEVCRGSAVGASGKNDGCHSMLSISMALA